MSDDTLSNNSFAAQHAAFPRGGFKVAPTDGTKKFNAIRIPLIPVACWRLSDPAFAFDSSFVSPTFKSEFVSTGRAANRPHAATSSSITTLSAIVAANPECPAALFGHCDPEGTDDLNKTLGDRRAMAVYALLTRQPDLWAYLYDTPQVGDTWDLHMVQTMLASVPDRDHKGYYGGAIDGLNGPQTTAAVKQFQTDAGLTADGDPGSQTRRALYGAYMDWLCTPEGTPPAQDGSSSTTATPLRMQPTDFLGGTGAQPGDLPQMSLQSCGKFNPVVLLATSEMASADKLDRHADDAPNRRVVMYFFAKGTKVDTAAWPCPKVKETNSACFNAFWPDGDQRRQNGAAVRLYTKTHDTMACRFYDRFARRSPCEGVLPLIAMFLPTVDARPSDSTAHPQGGVDQATLKVQRSPTPFGNPDANSADGSGSTSNGAPSSGPSSNGPSSSGPDSTVPSSDDASSTDLPAGDPTAGVGVASDDDSGGTGDT
jgi:hypothetical protein